MKKEDLSKRNKKIENELIQEFAQNRRILYFGIGLLGFIFVVFPFLVTKIIGVILVIFALLLYFSDERVFSKYKV